jgi:Mg2+ and Co2+ transporter CorA
MTEIEQLKKELEQVEHAIFCMKMSDDYCFTNGKIYPLFAQERDLQRRIAALAKKENDSEETA